jgi:predicted RNA-binding protein YlqC (UPF0109 family)
VEVAADRERGGSTAEGEGPRIGQNMKELIEFIASSLVEDPESVQVRELGGGDRVRLELSVARSDMGRVIGRGGKVANAIRTMLRVAAEREGKQATLDVVEPE